MKNLLLAAYKPKNISSNHFLTRLKKHIGESKAGYSGTLDPFASGLLVVGFGAHTRLLPFLQLTPKRYRATLWLGVSSPTLDIQGIESVREIAPLSLERVLEVLDSLTGEVSYTPPRFSAKHINGTRAYKLAREGVEFTLERDTMSVYEITLCAYNHPFLSFEVSISKGGYVRSLGELIAHSLGTTGALSSLHRISEGNISEYGITDSVIASYEMFFTLNPCEILPYPTLELCAYENLIRNGAKFSLQNTKSGVYKTSFEDFFSIIEVLANKKVKYLYNRIPYADTL
ncbi:tRNA pseudouridine(55) synthase TruB [uncultured Helicobacter sp.]|uniref:tRNA pseudouridine(55) synthase TruB n=1 Tax=uncultured Helicobacter sp. TaxID=175537 RepID=UPI00374F197A